MICASHSAKRMVTSFLPKPTSTGVEPSFPIPTKYWTQGQSFSLALTTFGKSQQRRCSATWDGGAGWPYCPVPTWSGRPCPRQRVSMTSGGSAGGSYWSGASLRRKAQRDFPSSVGDVSAVFPFSVCFFRDIFHLSTSPVWLGDFWAHFPVRSSLSVWAERFLISLPRPLRLREFSSHLLVRFG